MPPALGSNGTLTFTSAANGIGMATVTVVLKDDGGTANGGQDTSPAQTFTITVGAVNQAPSFVKGLDLAVNENAGPQTVASWATAISAGPPNEAGQKLSFTVTTTNNGLFAVPPALDSNGKMTFNPAPIASGKATVTVVLKDDGGIANGGHDTSASQSFTIMIKPVNQPPTVALTSPTSGQSFDAPATVVLRATAVDADGTVAEVEFFANGSQVGQALTMPYQLSWSNVLAGNYTLVARATDNSGATADSASVTITVRNALSLTLTSPLSGGNYCPGTPLAFAATVSGPTLPGTQVEFFLDGASIDHADTAPYSVFRPDGLPSGNHEAHARLLDAQGAVLAGTAPVQFTVLDLCGDVAILRNYDDPEVSSLVALLTGDDLLNYVQGRVDVFDQGQVTLERLLGYKLIVWAGLSRTGEGVTDADVDLLAKLQAAGKSLYLIGPHVASDTTRLSRNNSLAKAATVWK